MMEQSTTGVLSLVDQSLAKITWEIHKFFDLPCTADSVVKSPRSSFARAVWQLELFPSGGRSEDTEGFVDVAVTRLDSCSPCHDITVKLGIKSARGKERENHSFNCTLDESDPSYRVARYLRRSHIRECRSVLVPEGTLTVLCQIGLVSSTSSKAEESSSDEEQDWAASLNQLFGTSCLTGEFDSCTQAETQSNISIHQLQEDYRTLLQNEEDSDVCLQVSDKTFRAHKCILRARSSVFSAMFNHDTEEKASGKVIIEDLDPESFPDFLKYIYAGRVGHLSEENVFDLYVAADKYDVAGLKSECKDHMRKTLSVDTFCDVMILALKYCEDGLLEYATDFFAGKVKNIIITEKWQMFSRDYNRLANELLIDALISDDEK